MNATYLISQHAEAALARCWGCRDIMARLRRNPRIIRFRPRCPACGTVYTDRHDMTVEELSVTPVEGHA